MALNFLDIYADQKAARKLLESIAPIAFAQIESKLWTTTGEVDKWGGDRSPSHRMKTGMGQLVSDLNHCRRIEDPEFGADLAIRMGKAAGRFSASFKTWGHLNIMSPGLALILLCCHDSDNSMQLRTKLGIPEMAPSKLRRELVGAIVSGAMPASWASACKKNTVIQFTGKTIAPVTTVAVSSADAGLSSILQRCLAEEVAAQKAYDQKFAELEEISARLERAIERTKVIIRASEVVEELAGAA